MDTIIENQLLLRQLTIILSICGGIFSTYLGYRLLILGVSGTFKFKSELKGLKADLMSASPGLFFALLGFLIIFVALNHGFEINTVKKPVLLPSITGKNTEVNVGESITFSASAHDRGNGSIFYRINDAWIQEGCVTKKVIEPDK